MGVALERCSRSEALAKSLNVGARSPGRRPLPQLRFRVDSTRVKHRMPHLSYMNESLVAPRSNTDALPRLIDGITRALERSAHRGDLAWLRSLLVVGAEIEFTLARAPRVDFIALADESRDLHDLLTRPSMDRGDFAERYAAARAESRDLRVLHELVLATCAALAEPDTAPLDQRAKSPVANQPEVRHTPTPTSSREQRRRSRFLFEPHSARS
jgi:hypothetical protein